MERTTPTDTDALLADVNALIEQSAATDARVDALLDTWQPQTTTPTPMEDTLLARCLVAYEEAATRIDYPPHTQRVMRAGVAAVIEHLAAELLVMHQRNQGRLSAHDAAMLLREQALQEPSPLCK